MRGPTLKTIVQRILDAWRNLDPDIVIKSFRCCALPNAIEGTEDNEITFFSPGKQLETGKERQQKTMETRYEDYEIDPFNIAESDIEENPLNEGDDDSEEDEYVDLE